MERKGKSLLFGHILPIFPKKIPLDLAFDTFLVLKKKLKDLELSNSSRN